MKILFLLSCLILSNTSIATASSESYYANIYADQLIKKFDQQLANGKAFNNSSELYKRIQLTRELIEHNDYDLKKYDPTSLLRVSNFENYDRVQQLVETQLITSTVDTLIENSLNVYPSASRAGNITGNTFPENTWSLTFDDGPHKTITSKVLNNLISYGQQASFFVLAKKAIAHPTAVQSILDYGMELALHSYSHANLSKARAETIDYEIFNSKHIVENSFNTPLFLFRLPFGAGVRNPYIRQRIADAGMVHVFWNVDTLDWKDKNPESIFNRVLLQMNNSPKNSGIILFHDIHPQTVIASKMVMEYLYSNKLKVCTVGEVVKYINNSFQACIKPKKDSI